MLSAILLSIAVAQTTPAVRCIDPATPLQRLALEYDRWPAPRDGVARQGHELLRRAMQSRKASDYGTAILKYHNLNGDQSKSEDPHVQLALSILYLTGREFNFDGTEHYRYNRPQYNTNAERTAGYLLPKLVESDPTQWLGAVALARLAMQTRGVERYADARAALQRVLAADPQNITARLAWRDLLVAQDSVKEAAAYLDAHAVDCVPVMRARAESMMVLGDTAAGARMFLQALERAVPGEFDRYYQDLLVMADRDELKRLDGLPPAQRPAWIRAFWDRWSAAYGRPIERTVADQIVRAAFADAHFMRDRVQTTVLGRRGFVEDSSRSIPWDLRGVMYVRHGAPLHRLQVPRECGGYEAWVYLTDAEPWILAFARYCTRSGPEDWVLQEMPACGSEFLGARPVVNGEDALSIALERPDSLDMREIYEVLARYDQRYADMGKYCTQLAAGGENHLFDLLRKDIEVDRRQIVQEIQWGGTAYRQFFNPFRVGVEAYQFKTASGEPEIVVSTWMPTDDLDARGGRLALPRVAAVDFNFVVLDSTSAKVRDRTRVAIPPSGSGVLRTAYSLKGVPAGSAELRVIATDPADTTRGATRTVHLAVRENRPGIDMSDVILAQSGSGGSVVRGAARLSPIPGNTVAVGTNVRLFFELYGLTEGQGIKQTIDIVRTSKTGVRELLNLFPGARDQRTIGLEAEAELDSRGITVRDVEVAGDLVPGDYNVEITVVTGGRTIRRTAVLHMIAPS